MDIPMIFTTWFQYVVRMTWILVESAWGSWGWQGMPTAAGHLGRQLTQRGVTPTRCEGLDNLALALHKHQI